MTPVNFRFYNTKTKEKSNWLNGTRSTPSISARNWYRLNLNRQLNGVVKYHGAWDDSKGYNSVEFSSGRTMHLLRVDQVSLVTTRFEVGV